QSSGPRGGERLGAGSDEVHDDRSVGVGPVTGDGLDSTGLQLLAGGVGFQPAQQSGQGPGTLLRTTPGREEQVDADGATFGFATAALAPLTLRAHGRPRPRRWSRRSRWGVGPRSGVL